MYLSRIYKLYFLSFLLLMASCQMGQEKGTGKGVPIPMETYYMGRFSIGVPVEMKQTTREHELRDAEIREVVWPKDVNHEASRKKAWDNFMSEVQKLKPPKGADKIIVKTKDFPDVGKWAKGIFHHKNGDDFEEATWVLLMDSGPVGVWIKGRAVIVEEENSKNLMVDNIAAVGKSYRIIDSNAPRPKGDWFYLEHGAINLPYKWQEKSYVRFEGHPLKFTIEVEMNETYKVEPGINERTSSEDSRLMARVLGVSVDRIRTGKRKVAGLEGEEELDRIKGKKGKELSFTWEYVGKENSGEHPEIQISMDSPDGNLDEKLKIWDAILDSMQPMYK